MLLSFTGVIHILLGNNLENGFWGAFSNLQTFFGILQFALIFGQQRVFSLFRWQPSFIDKAATIYSRPSIFAADSPVEPCTDCGGKHYRKLPLSPGNPCNNGLDTQLPLTCFALPLNISTKIFCHQMTNDLFLSVIH